MARAPAIALIFLTACAHDPPEVGETGPRPEPPYGGPMPLAFGDCAPTTVAFVSGPRPLPFTVEDAELTAVPGDTSRAPFAPRLPTIAISRTRIGRAAVAELPAEPVDASPVVYPGHSYSRARRPMGYATVVIGGAPTVAGGKLDPAILRRYVRHNLEKLTYCYEVGLLAAPWLAGTMKVAFTIAGSGAVTAATATGVGHDVDACFARVVRSISFPAPKDGADVRAEYAFTLTPPPGSPVQPPPPPGRHARSRKLFRDESAAALTYKPGEHSVIAARADRLVACLRNDPRHRGAAVIDLTFDDAGVVKTSAVHGVHPTIATCLRGAVKDLRSATPQPAPVRCPLAYGETVIADAHGIDIGKSVALDGLAFGAAKQLDGRSIEALATTLVAKRAHLLASDGPVISVHPPLVVRPADDAPMRAVYSAIASITAAREDLVLAAYRDGEWQLLRPIASPIAPVPFNTGGMWSPIREPQRALNPYVRGRDPDPILSVFLDGAHRIWLGVTRLGEFQKLDAGPEQREQLLEALRRHKASSRFSDRTDLEIAAAADVPYGEVAAVITAASRTGFVDWQLLEEANLSIRPSP